MLLNNEAEGCIVTTVTITYYFQRRPPETIVANQLSNDRSFLRDVLQGVLNCLNAGGVPTLNSPRFSSRASWIARWKPRARNLSPNTYDFMKIQKKIPSGSYGSVSRSISLWLGIGCVYIQWTKRLTEHVSVVSIGQIAHRSKTLGSISCSVTTPSCAFFQEPCSALRRYSKWKAKRLLCTN